MDQFEALKQYKALMDEGILTQEEFEEKKKELLEKPIVVSVESEGGNSGAQAQAGQAAQTASLSTKATAIFSYLGIIFWLIGYFIGDKEGAKFHLNQGLVVNLAMFLCAIPVLGWIWAIFMLVVWIMGLVAAVNGEDKEVPLLGKIKLLN